ncbi:MAG: PTS sugar transporter subunit IIA [Elusimicrobia bacterium]|nr:PTS sugar transporter subunit IIA [Elusimicrobiota bacterium]
MKIKDFLSKDCIKLNLENTDKEGHIAELVDIFVQAGTLKESEAPSVVAKVMEREQMGSTGIGEGVSIPHIKIDGIDSIRGALGVSSKGVEFDALDGEPVYISFLLLTPESATNEHLKALSEISLFLKDEYYRDDLRNAENTKQVYKLIKRLG